MTHTDSKGLAPARRIWMCLRPHLSTAAAALAVFIGVHLWQTRDIPTGPAPELSFTLLSPEAAPSENTLAMWRTKYPGQPIAIHVWAEWCAICKLEETNVQRLSADHPIISIAMQSGPPRAVSEVLKRRQLPWATAVDAEGTLARALGVNAVPAFLVIDANGHMRSASVGYTSELGMRWRLLMAKLL